MRLPELFLSDHYKASSMKKLFIILIYSALSINFLQAQVAVTNLLTENQVNPVSIDATTPRFSWQLVSSKRNVLQTAYECKVMNGKTVAWSSGKVISQQSVMIPYAGTALQAGRQYGWQVKVWDNAGGVSSWSAPSFFKMGLLN